MSLTPKDPVAGDDRQPSSASESTSASDSISTPASDPISVPVPDPISTPGFGSISVSVPDPASAPIPESIPAPTSDPISAPMPESTSAPTPDPISAPTPDPTSAPTPDPISAPMSESTSAPMPELIPEPMPELISATMSESTSATMSESTSAPMSESTSAPMPDSISAPVSGSISALGSNPISAPVPDSNHAPTTGSKTRIGLLIVVFALLGGLVFFIYDKEFSKVNEDSVAIEKSLATDLNTSETNNVPPSDTEGQTSQSKAQSLPPLPPYAQANDFINRQLGLDHWKALNISPQNFPVLTNDFLLQRAVAFLDGLAKGEIRYKLMPFARPQPAFIADKEGQTLSMGAANFSRYDTFIQSIIAIDTEQAAIFFHWTRPLLETAYSELGYPGEELSATFIAAIDTLLATPTIEGSIALKRKSVLYQYADPELEALPGAQKQMLRIGAKNASLLKSWLRELRSALLKPN